MRWLTHGTSLAPAVKEALIRHGHKVVTTAEINLEADATPDAVLEAAHKAQLDVLTTDGALAESPFGGEPSPFVRTIVYLQLEGGDVEQDDAIDRLFERYKRLAPGKVYTVTATRVKIRQLPGTH